MANISTIMGHKVTNPELFIEKEIIRENKTKGKVQVAFLPNNYKVLLGQGLKIVKKPNGNTYTNSLQNGISRKIKGRKEEYIRYPRAAVHFVERLRNFAVKLFPKKSPIREILASINIPRGKWLPQKPKAK